MFKNKFFIIIGLSIITMGLLIFGAITLHKDNSLSFSSDGYILSINGDKSNKYNFKTNTKYKSNVDDDITFSDKESNNVVVTPASFVHYSNGAIAFLKKGAIVNLAEITNNIVNYYNVNKGNIIDYDNNNYVVGVNNKKVNINSFIGRISDNKYIVAGNDLSLKIPNKDDEVKGDYFEVLFIKDGIAKIYNDNDSFQVTAQGSYFYLGSDIIISLGDGKISYDGDVKMLMSQITINGNENIDLDTLSDTGSGGGSLSDEDENSGTGEETLETKNEDENGSGGGGDGDGVGSLDSDSNNNSVNDRNNAKNEQTAKIELVSADVSITFIDAKFLLNNVNYVKGKLKAYITNVGTGNNVDFTINGEETNEIPLKNGTFDLLTSDSDKQSGNKEFHLNPDTDYLIRIVGEDGETVNQYFQKIFRTKSLGLTLEKKYATEDSLKYRISFDGNNSVDSFYLNISGNGYNDARKVNVVDDYQEVYFEGLTSNTNYSVYINNVTIKEDNGTAVNYASRYNISRIDSTLKKIPVSVGRVVNVETDSENAKFIIKVKNIEDTDKAIVSYTYEIYLNDEDGKQIYSVTKNVNNNADESEDATELILNLSEIKEMSAGVSYRCRVVANYNNNEMIREVVFDDGAAFSMKGLPNINWNDNNFKVGKYNVSGNINLIDASCTVPIRGRKCSNSNENYTIKDTDFVLKYYVSGEEEKTAKEVKFKFNPDSLEYKFNVDDLLSNTNYIMKIYGSYYDDSNNYHENVPIGNSVYFTTAKSDNLSLVINSINSSNDKDVVNMVMHLDKGTSTEKYEDLVTSVSINLYSGGYNNPDKLIGNYKITNRSTIEDLFKGLTITNGLFTNLTKFPVSKVCDENKLCDKDSLINATNNSAKILNNSYTIEIESVNVGMNKLFVENPLYTYILTSSYYLDARISSNPNNKYVVIDKIKKSDLTDEQKNELKNNISNFDSLLDDTVVGVKITNKLSDLFVDSAFSYEKAVVNYVVSNKVMDKETNNYRYDVVKKSSKDMGNKYQPSEEYVWLDLTDTKDGFIRGNSYEVGFNIDFTIDSSSLTSDQDKNVVTYNNECLHSNIIFDRQKPIFKQYISTSDKNSITYKYSMTDVDNALYDNIPYYSYKESSSDDFKDFNIEDGDKFIIDGEIHTIKLPFDISSDYHFGYHLKKINNSGSANYEMDSYNFSSRYDYDNEISFKLIKDVYDNKLKILLENNDVNNKAIAYKVSLSGNGVNPYNMFYIKNKLDKYGDEPLEGEEDNRPYYIAVDYANISRFLNKDITVNVSAYYENGIVGYDNNFDNGLVIKNINDKKYLNIYNGTSTAASTNSIENSSNSINYVRNKTDDRISLYSLFTLDSINKYNPNNGTAFFNNITVDDKIGINYVVSSDNTGFILSDGKKKYSKYNFRMVNIALLNNSDNIYRFDSITPKIGVSTVSTINSFKIKIKPSGIYSKEQFRKNNASDNNIYIEFYSDKECNNKISTIPKKISFSETSSGYNATIDDSELTDLKSDTNYYFKIYAYIDNKYTQLYDESSTNKYVSLVYNAKTLSGSEIIKRVNFSVKPTAYNGESSLKSLTWKLNFNNTDNYKVRFELYKPNGTETITDDEGNAKEINKYSLVNFNGTDASSCNNNLFGNNSNGYVNGCYISVSKDEISAIASKDQVYTFSGNDFVFGGAYYKLVIYAVPYTNGNYKEEDKVVLYENDALTTTGEKSINGVLYNIDIPTLEVPTFKLDDFESGYSSSNGYYIKFVPTCNDHFYDSTGKLGSFVIKNGKYTATLYDDKGRVVSINNDISADNANKEVIFSKLSSDKLYSVELSYENYRNNVGFSESEKIAVRPFVDYIYTPSSELGIRIGTVTGEKISNQKIQLLYSGSVNLSKKIVRIDYTITLKSGTGNKNSGSYRIDDVNNSIFTNERDNLLFVIDFSDEDFGHSSNNKYALVDNQAYIINTQYYYMDNGSYKLFDEITSFLNT